MKKIQKYAQLFFPLIAIIIGLIGSYSLIYENEILDVLLHMSLGMILSGLIFMAEW